jgi:hypothetical protein
LWLVAGAPDTGRKVVRASPAIMLALGVLAPRQLAGQLAVGVAAGARYSTPLVRDSIVTPFNVRPALAPMVAVTLATPLTRDWAADITLDFSTSPVWRHDSDGSRVAVGRVSTAAFTVGLERRLPAGFFTRIGVGGLKDIPSENSGIFRLGSGSIAGLGALALGHALPLGGRDRFTIEARYDVHGFTTPALRDEGFGSARAVHRVALILRADTRGVR